MYTGLTDSAPHSEFELRMEGSRRLLSYAFVRPGAHRVSDNYFRVLGIPLIAGRQFTEAETPGPPSGVVVSRRFAMDTWSNT